MGFCKCPRGASFNIKENKCICNNGRIPSYSSTSLGSLNPEKMACCPTKDCNDNHNNPGFDPNIIGTYKFYNCDTHICEPYS